MAPSLEHSISHEVELPVLAKEKAPDLVEVNSSPEPSGQEVKNGRNGHILLEETGGSVQRPVRTFELEDHPIDAPSKIRVCPSALCSFI